MICLNRVAFPSEPTLGLELRQTLRQALGLTLGLTVLCLIGCRNQDESRPGMTPSEFETSESATSEVVAAEDPRTTLLADPANVDALRLVAKEHASGGRFLEAAEVANTLAGLQTTDPVGDLLRAFDWHLRGGDPVGAERDLERAVDIAPQDPRGHRMMAQLLNSQGRRFEARPYVISLARLNAVTHRELISLIDIGGPFQLVSFDGVLPNKKVSLFDLGNARHQLVADEDLSGALATVQRLSAALPGMPVVEAFRGRVIAQTRDNNLFVSWMKNVPAGTDRHPDYWMGIGTWLSHQDRHKESVRAFGEALKLDPTDRVSLRALSAALSRLGESERAKQTQETLAVLDQIFRLATLADPSQAMWIGEQLQSLTRPWESIGWYRHAFQMQGAPPSRMAAFNDRQNQVQQWETQAGIDQIRDARLTKMLGFEIDQYPAATFDLRERTKAIAEPARAKSPLRFRDVAKEVGVNTTFVSGYSLSQPNFYLYQANGGGIAAFDYDLDGRCDLYFAQSGGDPQQSGASTANQLFRQLPTQSFLEVSDRCLAADRGFGQGVCAADVNQDGFPDLLIANIGGNSLYINQGDGFFRAHTDLIRDDLEQWTSSIAVADLSGDQLPEIVEINYVEDPLIFERMCEGKQLACTPQRFRAACDRIYKSAGNGTFRSWSGAKEMDQLPNYGFGVVIADFDGRFGNDVFISNDGDLNHFWKSVLEDGAGSGNFELIESAGVAGCSIGTSGLSQACMGVASGDFDQNGLIDLAVTNFHNEPLNLFLQNDAGFFVDDALKYGLVEPAKDLLGFGIQSCDFDNDGWSDLAVLNGHIYDARYAGIPFRMVSQLMVGGPGGFTLQEAEVGGPYWAREQLARTLARLDWNRDGKMDLVANHLDQPIAILENQSATENWLQMELTGVASERSAVGARVVVHAGQRQWILWRTAGDGYMCTNEAVLHLGVGRTEQIDRVEVQWPSGASQEFRTLAANRRYLFIEGEQLPIQR